MSALKRLYDRWPLVELMGITPYTDIGQGRWEWDCRRGEEMVNAPIIAMWLSLVGRSLKAKKLL